MADGEGGEVGIHPDFGGGGGESGEGLPNFQKDFWFVEPEDLGKGEQVLARRPSCGVGDRRAFVSPLDEGCADEAQKGLLGRPAKSRGLGGVARLEVPRGNPVVRVGGEGERHPEIGIIERDQGAGDPPG